MAFLNVRMRPLLLIALAIASTFTATAADDIVFITAVNPAYVTDGVETEVEIRAAYSLQSDETATISLSFNDLFPQGGSPKETARVKRGSGELVFRAKITPRIWSELIAFKATTRLERSSDGPAQSRVTASDSRKLAVLSGPLTSEPDKNNSRPQEVYENGIAIISITPDVLKVGQAQEITVRCKYELLSRDTGQINLGWNIGRANGYRIVNQTLVSIGKGEITITATIMPLKTMGYPFAKIHVNLSEYPHAGRWGPLANDSVAIAVE